MKKITKREYLKRVQTDEELMQLFHRWEDGAKEIGEKRRLIQHLEAEILLIESLMPEYKKEFYLRRNQKLGKPR